MIDGRRGGSDGGEQRGVGGRSGRLTARCKGPLPKPPATNPTIMERLAVPGLAPRDDDAACGKGYRSCAEQRDAHDVPRFAASILQRTSGRCAERAEQEVGPGEG